MFFIQNLISTLKEFRMLKKRLAARDAISHFVQMMKQQQSKASSFSLLKWENKEALHLKKIMNDLSIRMKTRSMKKISQLKTLKEKENNSRDFLKVKNRLRVLGTLLLNPSFVWVKIQIWTPQVTPVQSLINQNTWNKTTSILLKLCQKKIFLLMKIRNAW